MFYTCNVVQGIIPYSSCQIEIFFEKMVQLINTNLTGCIVACGSLNLGFIITMHAR